MTEVLHSEVDTPDPATRQPTAFPLAGDRRIRRAAITTIVIVAMVGTAISSWHAYELIHGAGEPAAVAAGYPALIDGVIFMASMVMLWCSRRRVRAPALAWLALAFGALVTLAVNVAHGLQSGNLSGLVSAIPPLAVIGSYELLMRLMRMAGADATTTAEQAPASHPADTRPEVAETEPEPQPAPRSLAEAVRLARADGMSIRALAREFETTRSRVEKILNQDGPEAAEAADDQAIEDGRDEAVEAA